jgi:8-oxo-dGTP pyrophosphatase MutT (NUDIX family)
MSLFVQQLTARFTEPLPGTQAQFKMTHSMRVHSIAPPTDAKVAAVMLLLYQKNERWHTALIRRVTTGHPDDKHSGQVSFPGGKQEPNDKNMAYTALRETHEEIGIPMQTIQLVGQLTELYIPISNFLVYPFVGYTAIAPTFQLQTTEVKHVLEVPILHFFDSEYRKKIDMRFSTNIMMKDVPYFDIFGNVVWGATAMILSEFATLAAPFMEENRTFM